MKEELHLQWQQETGKGKSGLKLGASVHQEGLSRGQATPTLLTSAPTEVALVFCLTNLFWEPLSPATSHQLQPELQPSDHRRHVLPCEQPRLTQDLGDGGISGGPHCPSPARRRASRLLSRVPLGPKAPVATVSAQP